MAIAEYPSIVSLPQTNPGVANVLEYLIIQFPFVDEQTCHQRITDGKVHCHDGSLITTQSPFKAQQRIYYYREVENEPSIPFKEEIVFEDQYIIVAYKPHFLAVIPSGQNVTNVCNSDYGAARALKPYRRCTAWTG